MEDLISSDFEEFKRTFTGGNNRMKEISNFDVEAKVIVTYKMVQILDTYIRNRLVLQKRKMVALTYLRYIYAN